MALGGTLVNLSTFLLERNRWSQKGPSLQVSEWMEPIAEAGYSGVEIWAPHLFLTSRSEWEAIRRFSQELELPVVSVRARIPVDAGDKSRRQRDFLLEASDYFEPQGLKFSPADGGEAASEQLAWVGEWSRDLPRGVGLVQTFEASEAAPEAIRQGRRLLGARFRCALNPFSRDADVVEPCLTEAGSSLVDLDIRIEVGGRYGSLRDRQPACSQVAVLLGRSDFKGSWTLAGARGMGAAKENSDDLFDAAEEDLNFLQEELERLRL